MKKVTYQPDEPRRGESWLTRKRRPDAPAYTPAAPTHVQPGRNWRRPPQSGSHGPHQGYGPYGGQHTGQYAGQYAAGQFGLPNMSGVPMAAPLVVTPTGEVVPLQYPAAPVEEKQDQRPGVTKAAKAWAWRNRWQLAPAYASTATVVGSLVDPRATVVALTIGGVAAVTAERLAPEADRKWLSRRERKIVRRWFTRAGLWTAGSGLTMPLVYGVVDPLSWWGLAATAVNLGAFGAAVANPTSHWLASREFRKDDGGEDKAVERSDHAAALVRAWPLDMAAFGPAALRGSSIVGLDDKPDGTIVATIQLRGDMHAQQAVTKELRLSIERRLNMPLATVFLDTIREHSGQIRLTLTPSRTLETTPAAWAPVKLSKDGTFPLARNIDGTEVRIHTFSASGVEHLLLLGVTDTGKSFTLVACILPGVLAKKETVWYADGGGGSSSSHVAAAVDWFAPRRSDWKAVIAAAGALLEHRKNYRSALGISKWRGLEETVPIVTVVFEEATTIRGALTKTEIAIVFDLLREGRKYGIRVIQSTQDPLAELLIAGRPGRDQIAGGGAVIGHRMGGAQAARLASDSTPSSEDVDLREMPAEPGFCAVYRRGQVRTKLARVMYAEPSLVADAMKGLTPRGLDDAKELAAVGEAYATRLTGARAAALMAARQEAEAKGEEFSLDWDTAAVDKPASTAAVDVTKQPTVATNVVPAAETTQAGLSPAFSAPVPAAVASITAASGHSTASDTRARHTAILATLRAEPDGMTRAELAKKLGLAAETVKKRTAELRQMGHLEVIETADGRHLWRLIAVRDAA